ncbi:NAD(P)H-binding protein [Pseudonocardia sp. DR1-2]|uniref:NmrA family NAD(P)-binding protein n=1 Tax=Pseudonocardia sp. DR1-2 TaxID=2951168 RepID=UPI002044C306|nr:NAD(P)H-binding protein [Pseudonocardia sp. DR1-2]MCM3848329.1 NAD(P)H-binding protein [Pseudonocardia sp. DR1-2]
MTTTVLVTGATGGIGGHLLTALAGRDVTVRALVRDPDRLAGAGGVEVVRGDLRDPDAVAAALDGVDAAFLNSPSAPDAATTQIAVADAAATAGVSRLVLLSQFAARADSPVRFLRWHAAVEQHVRDLGIGHVVLRPNLFLQGLLAFAPLVAATGRFGAPIGDAAVSAVDVRDIADAATAVLTGAGPDGAVHDLTGPRAVTHAGIAAALTRATGHPVTFDDLTPEAFAAALDGVLPPWQAAGLVEDYAHYGRGEAARVDDAVAVLTGHPARTLEEFARDHAAAFAPAG